MVEVINLQSHLVTTCGLTSVLVQQDVKLSTINQQSAMPSAITRRIELASTLEAAEG